MRLYTFTHFMLSPMAKGIQATHSTVELFNKYPANDVYNQLVLENPEDRRKSDMLYNWSINHKTMISLNAGLTPDLELLIEFFEYGDCPFPWAFFNEDESLGELVTSVSIILPEYIYDTAEKIKKKEITWDAQNNYFLVTNGEWMGIHSGDIKWGEFELDLVHRLGNYRMAS